MVAVATASLRPASRRHAAVARAWHVVHDGRGWTVREETGGEQEGPWSERATALRYARERARSHRATVVEHRADGTIEAIHAY